MTTILVWLLLVTSNGGNAYGHAHVMEKFPTAEMCEHVRRNIPGVGVAARCIQAEILVPK